MASFSLIRKCGKRQSTVIWNCFLEAAEWSWVAGAQEGAGLQGGEAVSTSHFEACCCLCFGPEDCQLSSALARDLQSPLSSERDANGRERPARGFSVLCPFPVLGALGELRSLPIAPHPALFQLQAVLVQRGEKRCGRVCLSQGLGCCRQSRGL